MKLISAIIFLAISMNSYSQTDEEKAIHNFNIYYHSLEPKNQTDSLIEFSELWTRSEIPEEIKIMIAYHPNDFYDKYLNFIENSRDTLIKISSIDLSEESKNAYLSFRKSVMQGKAHGQFDYRKDKAWSKVLIRTIDQTNPPKIGYHQTAVIVSEFRDGHKEKNKIIITYSLELEPIEFETIAD